MSKALNSRESREEGGNLPVGHGQTVAFKLALTDAFGTIDADRLRE